MRIAGRRISRETPPFIIAEIGVNHDGSPERAVSLLRAAADAGADAVKFQWFEAERLLSQNARLAAYQRDAGERDPVEMLRRLELPAPVFEMLIEESHVHGLAAIVTVFSVEVVAGAALLPWDAFKIASPDLVNRPLIEAIRVQGRPMILSTGAASLAEVRASLDWIDRSQSMYLQCVSSYPAPEDAAALGGVAAIEHETGRPAGYSDHTEAVDTGALAVAAGACVLEKHLTDDRGRRGPDHRASLEPEQFATYAAGAHRAWRMRGPDEKHLQEIEEDVRAVARQSVAVVRDLSAGHLLRRADLTPRRPGTGIPAAALCDLIGVRLARAVKTGALLSADDLETKNLAHEATA